MRIETKAPKGGDTSDEVAEWTIRAKKKADYKGLARLSNAVNAAIVKLGSDGLVELLEREVAQ